MRTWQTGIVPVSVAITVLLVGASVTMADELGSGLVRNPTDRVLRVDKVVRASRDAVWRAWATEAGVTAFGPPAAKIELRVGGRYEWYFFPDAPQGSRGAEGCRVLSFVPNQSLAFTWNAPPSIAGLREAGARTQVHLRIEEADRGRVRVRLTQFGFGEGDAWDQYYDYFASAWRRVLNALAHHFESKRASAPEPEPRPYIYFIEPMRKTFEQDATPQEQAIVGRHFEYLKRLHEAGDIIIVGRTQDKKPPIGIVVFEAASDEQAEKVFRGDPAVEAGIFVGSVRPYGVALMRE